MWSCYKKHFILDASGCKTLIMMLCIQLSVLGDVGKHEKIREFLHHLFISWHTPFHLIQSTVLREIILKRENIQAINNLV